MTLARTGCHGSCPLYSVAVTGDGDVTYDGNQFVRVTGRQQARADVASVHALFERVAKSRLFEREWPHPKCFDFERVELSLKRGHSTASVTLMLQEDCKQPGLPADAFPVVDAVDEVAGTSRWVPCLDVAGKAVDCPREPSP